MRDFIGQRALNGFLSLSAFVACIIPVPASPVTDICMSAWIGPEVPVRMDTPITDCV